MRNSGVVTEQSILHVLSAVSPRAEAQDGAQCLLRMCRLRGGPGTATGHLCLSGLGRKWAQSQPLPWGEQPGEVRGPGAPHGHRSSKNQAVNLDCEVQTAQEGTHHQGQVFKFISSQESGLPGGGEERPGRPLREWTEDRWALC